MRAFLAAVLLLAVLPARAAENVEIKMATLAPKGSAWAKIMESAAKEADIQTGGRVKFKFFFGGQQGDERDVVRKMKLGQLDGAAVTAVGLGLIKGDVRVLELPFLFKNDKEIDYVRSKLAPEFEKQFDEAGYFLYAWGDVGWTYVYTNNPIHERADLQKAKMWAWTDDQIVRALFQRLGVNGVPLGVPDVLPSLQTGQINGCYGPPLAAVALQWYTKVKYGTSMPINYSIGAMVIKKDIFNKMSTDDQTIMRAIGKKMESDLLVNIRRDNERAKKAMEKSGVTFVATPAAVQADFEKLSLSVYDDLAGKVYSKEFLQKIRQHVADARK